MTDQDLDTCYAALCDAIDRVGEQRAPLFLSMVALSLLARQPDAGAVLPRIQQAEEQTID
jgi:hypothetical protein